MSEPAKQFNGTSDNTLGNSAIAPNLEIVNSSPYRSSGAASSSAIGPPVLPPRPDMGINQNYGMNPSYSYSGMGNFGMGSYGNYGGFGGLGGYGGYGMGGLGGMGMSPYGGYNRFGPSYGEMESRFIQMAEENSRPAFDSIQSFVNAVGSVAMMLENTFFALTSSFRAILGVAENFGRLRSLFAQFWSTFAVVRTLNWMVRKLMVILGIRSECEFKAWAEAVSATQNGTASPEQRARGSSWPVLMFFGVVVAAPYLVIKMLNGLSASINERLNDPITWQKPMKALAQFDFQATTPQEISFSANQILMVAPQHLQSHLWNSGWLMASADRQHAGLIPVNYVKIVKPSDVVNDENVTVEKELLPSNENLEKLYTPDL
ncbi:hypothetical protein ACJJTC_015873 [Scirpophaga incertulas]